MDNVKTAGSRLLATVMAVCLAAVMALGASALLAPADQAFAATNQKVLDQRSGVFKFNWGNDKIGWYASGSAFLINKDTVVTAHHCVVPSTAALDLIESRTGIPRQEILDESKYTVTIAGDFQVPATLEKYSEKQDMAILKLEKELNNVTPLTLRDSSEVDASEEVYSLGFPVSADQNAVVTFTSNDVAVVDGTVSKPEGQMNYADDTGAMRSGSFIMSTCRIESGSSGGPMVDADGNVIGISVSGDSSFYYAASSDVLMDALDTMAYDYKKSSGSDIKVDSKSSESASASASSASASASSASSAGYTISFTDLNAALNKAKGHDSSKYTEESYKTFTAAREAAEKALTTELSDKNSEEERDKAQEEVDAATKALEDAMAGLVEAPQGPNIGIIIAIVVAVVVVIAIIVLVIIMRSRNKKKQAEAPTVPLAGNAPAPTGVQPILNSGPQSWQKPGSGAVAPSAGSNETTILDDEASDTVILFQAASGGSLTRMSTNEQIPINCAEFSIGRERSKVNYCLEGNTSISRVHVRIVVRDGKVYCVDNKAANGTFINGVKCRPGEENLLKSGDIITLADEKFKYNA